MLTITQDLSHAFRVLRKSPGFAVIAVSALALGIGANTAIFSVVNHVLLQPLPYPEPDRLVRVGRTYPNGNVGTAVSIPKFNFWSQHNQVFDSAAAYDFSGPGLNVGGGDRPEQIKGIHVSRDFFRVFGVSPKIGRTFSVEEDLPRGPRAAIISEGLWRRRFGADPQISGRTITMNDEPYIVIGVLPGSFVADPEADVWIAMQADPNSQNQGHFLLMAARLKPSVTVATANASMKVAAEQFRKQNPKNMSSDESAGVRLLRDAIVGDIRPALLILFGSVGLVLLIACANVANLLLARATSRKKEIAIRSAIGAGRGRIVQQLLTESVLLAAVGGALGLVLGYAGVRGLLALSPGDLPRIPETGSVPLDWRILLFTAGLSLCTGILFGLLPALQISRTDLNTSLRESSGRSGTGLRQNRARGVLVVAETALALVLLIAAALLIRTFQGLRNVNAGFSPHHVLTLQTSLAGTKYEKTAAVEILTRQALERIQALPGVEAAATALSLPLQGPPDLPFVIAGRTPKSGDFEGDEAWLPVGAQYFKVFSIPLLRGRVFNRSDVGNSTPVVLISDSFAKKYFPKQDPIGSVITIAGKSMGPNFEDKPRQIVGVVGEVRQFGLKSEPSATMYVPSAQLSDSLNALGNGILPQSWVVKATSDPRRLAAAIEKEILAVDPQLPVGRVRTMDALVAESTARQTFNMVLLSIFAGIALVLAAIGIYGLMSYSVEQRTPEIGIRMALGAGRSTVLGMIVRQGMQLVILGVVVGIAAAWGLTRLMENLLFGVKPTDLLTFLAVPAVLVFVALFANVIPARRATKVDPVIALRFD